VAASLFRQQRVLVELLRVCVQGLERVRAIINRANDSDVVRRAILVRHQLQRYSRALGPVNQPLDLVRPLALPDMPASALHGAH